MTAATTFVAIQTIPKAASCQGDEDNDAGGEDDEDDGRPAPASGKDKSPRGTASKNPWRLPL